MINNDSNVFSLEEIQSYITDKLIKHLIFLKEDCRKSLDKPIRTLNYLNSLSPDKRALIRQLFKLYNSEEYSSNEDSSFLIVWIILNETASTPIKDVNYYKGLVDNFNKYLAKDSKQFINIV